MLYDDEMDEQVQMGDVITNREGRNVLTWTSTGCGCNTSPLRFECPMEARARTSASTEHCGFTLLVHCISSQLTQLSYLQLQD